MGEKGLKQRFRIRLAILSTLLLILLGVFIYLKNNQWVFFRSNCPNQPPVDNTLFHVDEKLHVVFKDSSKVRLRNNSFYSDTDPNVAKLSEFLKLYDQIKIQRAFEFIPEDMNHEYVLVLEKKDKELASVVIDKFRDSSSVASARNGVGGITNPVFRPQKIDDPRSGFDGLVQKLKQMIECR